MHEIICPHCNKAFKIDESGYADILKQVHDEEFQKQINDRLELADKEKATAIELAKQELGNETQKTVAAKDAQIVELKTQLDTNGVNQKLAVNEAVGSVEKERDKLANEIHRLKQESEAAAKLAQANLLNELQSAAAKKDAVIQELQSKINNVELSQKLVVNEAVGVVEKQRDELKNDLQQAELK